jgi:hypothetical protein
MSAADRPSRIKQILEAGEYVSRDEIAWLIAEVERLLSPVERLTNEVLAHAIAADLASPLCQQCDDLGPYDRSPESCPYCAAIRVEAVLRAFPAGSGPQQDGERLTDEEDSCDEERARLAIYDREGMKAAEAIRTMDGWPENAWPSPVERIWFSAMKQEIERLRSGGPTPEGEPNDP